jgi:hypothetical protein
VLSFWTPFLILVRDSGRHVIPRIARVGLRFSVGLRLAYPLAISFSQLPLMPFDRGRFWLRKVPLAFQCLMLTPLLLHIYVYGLAPVVGLAEYGEFRRLRGKLGLGAAALGGSTPYQWVMRHGL